MKWFSNETISFLLHLIKRLILLVAYVGAKIRATFSGDCLKQEKITFNQVKVITIYPIYEIEGSVNISSYPTLENFIQLTLI